MKTVIGVSLVLMALGLIVLAGWSFGWSSVTNVGFDVSMKPATAIGFILTGVILSTSVIRGPKSDLILAWAAMSLWLLMTAILWESILDSEIGATSLFLTENIDGTSQSERPGEPSLGTCAAFLMVATLGFSEVLAPEKRAAFVPWTVTFLGAVAVVGYLCGIPLLYFRVPGYSTAMAIHTAIGFVAAGAAGVWIETGDVT